MQGSQTTASDARPGYEELIVPHLDAAYRLARWRLRNPHDAEDAVQEASLRAIRYSATFRGGNARAWFLRIVSNVCSDWYGRRGPDAEPFDEEQHAGDPAADPEALLTRRVALASIEQAIASLPDTLREVIVLREIEGLTYRELADVIGIPAGTVMSRLSRARRALAMLLTKQLAPA